MNAPIYITLGSPVAAPSLGSSHWFGYPDLAPGMEVPTVTEDGEDYALSLICQINLADLPADSGFPTAGLLLFFADVAYYCGDWDEPAISMFPSNNRVCRVLYVPADRMADLTSTRELYCEQDEPEAIALTFSRTKPEALGDPDLQLLGSTDHLEWETWPEPCQGWQLLLQMDSMDGADFNYNFVDTGVLCFIIDPEDLARRDFSDVRAIILST